MILRRVTLARPVALTAALVLALLLGAPAAGHAHEIPQSVTILAWLKPEGSVLRLVARVPLEAMRDVQWPLRGPGYLELGDLDRLLRDGTRIWVAENIHMYEGGSAIGPARIAAVRVSLQSDRSFETYAGAVAHFRDAPIPANTDLAWQQAMVDLELDYPITSATSRFSIDPSLGRLGVRTTTVLHFIPPAGDERTFTYLGDPGLVHLEPQWFQAAGQFIALGFRHILDGIDHLLFIICLVIPFRRLRPLVVIATSFTVAHSITMVVSALGYAPGALWFPPLVEVLIAASIVYTALENIVGAQVQRRWMIAFGFGLVHGFGFSFALRESLQFAGHHLAVSLATFNIGVELGQIFVLCLAVPALNWLFRRIPVRTGMIIASALVAHTAWHWMTDRWSVFREFPIEWPASDAALGAAVLRSVILILVCGAAVFVMRPVVNRVTAVTDS
ncbi:MAG TPA: HupE/UreJ family protein [Gemmatimonadaceae bacterium]|nr:HupE/UreJ family protein [Gemmatimonadaceae bacterium]